MAMEAVAAMTATTEVRDSVQCHRARMETRRAWHRGCAGALRCQLEDKYGAATNAKFAQHVFHTRAHTQTHA